MIAPPTADLALFDYTPEELDRYPVGVVTLDRAGIIAGYNRSESALSRLQPEAVIGRSFFRIAPCTAVRAYQGRFEKFALGETTAVEQFDWSFMFFWGQQDVTITLMRRSGRREIYMLVRLRSHHTPVPLARLDALAANRGRFDPLDLGRTDVGVWADDPSHGSWYRSEGFWRIVGSEPVPDASPDPFLRFVHPDHAGAVGAEVESARAGLRSYMVRTLIAPASGGIRDVFVHGGFFTENASTLVRSAGTIIDLTNRRNAEKTLWASAHLDPLTHLPNRRLLIHQLESALASDPVSVAVCFIDLDKFKNVNDSAGHAVGDEVLRVVAKRLQLCLRESDVVSRINGDEFVVLLLEEAATTRPEIVIGRLLDALNEPIELAGRTLRISASGGIARAPGDGRDPETLLHCADLAMYRAKQRGPGSYRTYLPEMRIASERDIERGEGLREAVAAEQIVAYFQPIVDARTRRTVGAEALARWEHPELGILPPSEFIALAESSGAIAPLGTSILRQACRRARVWFDGAGEASPFVSVNVSPQQFRDSRFADIVRGVLAETGLPAHKLELEFTESIVIERFEETLEVLGALKVLGVRLSIDDFGTGYSALAYLKYFPIDTIKLDQTFVAGLGHNSVDEAIAETIILLARKLDVAIIAEGVETDAQALMLGDLACTSLQGFLFARPMPAEAFERFLGAAPAPVS